MRTFRNRRCFNVNICLIYNYTLLILDHENHLKRQAVFNVTLVKTSVPFNRSDWILNYEQERIDFHPSAPVTM